jgi:hypothetical protein
MKPELLATLRAAGEAATNGPWADVQRSGDGGHQVDSCVTGDCIVDTVFGSDDDAAFIALARNHWGELLDAAEERDRLRGEVERMRSVLLAVRERAPAERARMMCSDLQCSCGDSLTRQALSALDEEVPRG